MKESFWRSMYWATWPLLWIYAPLKTRSRILIVCGNEFLAVKSYYGSGVWDLPGGGVHLGETPTHAAVRELREETGLKINENQLHPLITLKTFRENGLLYRFHIYWTKVVKKEEITIQTNEIIDAAWLPLSQLKNPLSTHVVTSVKAYKHLRV